MTPKEKAIKLIERFQDGYKTNNIVSYKFINVSNEDAKQCALIVVDESIENLEFIHKPEYVSILIQGQFIDIYKAIEYWKEVKQEIEKL